MSANQSVEQLTIRSRQLIAVLERVPVENYRRLLLLLSFFWLLWLLAGIFWLIMPIKDPAVLSTSFATTQDLPSEISKRKTVNLAVMQGWHLFGELNQEAVVETVTAEVTGTDVDENAQETRLSLRLEGVVEATNPSHSWAIIEHQSKSDLYKIGQTLPAGNGVTLSRVLSDRAIIDNRGRYEALFLYDEKGNRVKPELKKTTQASAKEKKTVDQRNNKRLSEMAANYRQQLIDDPMSLSDVIKISPANDSDGKLMGYRVRPGKHRQQFKEFGLKAGDIVTSVNGVELNDPSNTMTLYHDLRNTTEATIEVKRGSEIISLVVGIGDN